MQMPFQVELHRLRLAEGPSLLQANRPWYGLAIETSNRPCQSNSLTKERSLSQAQAILREIPTTSVTGEILHFEELKKVTLS